ncbi:MAG: electron transfer flavoprotein subunit alpha/FixB family protein [Planctomycetes bacterium]|nr:electron transfer flavoprotein subunit alpha/FixB family protein [Planctomycetota bacterium]MCB9890896.1 electron transfer flavoprotein subunit alpha/FixB family protein [Planctomycetota bacterium]
MGGILVYLESKDGRIRKSSLEALSAAASLETDVIAVLYGPNTAAGADEAARYGASRIVAFQADDAPNSPEAARASVLAQAEESKPAAIFLPATAAGRDLAPRLAARLGWAQASDVTEVRAGNGGVEARRPVYAGKAYTWVAAKTGGLVVTTRPNVFVTVEKAAQASVETKAPPSTDLRSVVREIVASAGGKLDVSEAPIVVAGGRGMKAAENWQLLERLADAFGGRAALGASRAVVDSGWRPHAEQVGQTGKVVAPQLYIAVGISGAIQHLAGMRTSKVIVAINKDPEAAIFKVADYGIVGDALEILPALTSEIAGALA